MSPTPPFTTPLSRRLGLRYPIVMAPMFIVSNVEMLVAGAEAGVLGTMPSLNCREPEQFTEALRELNERCRGPYGINIPMKLAPPERIEHDIARCLEYKVPVIITSLGNPAPVVEQAHREGLLVFHDVINLRHGRAAKRAGVDAIIGVAAGAGGHAGRISPFVLYPWLREELDTPIIAAGTITTGQQVAASLALGTELVYMGTRFIASAECAAHPEYKQMIVEAGPEDIEYTDQVSGIHGNFLRATIPGMGEPGAVSDEAKQWKEIWSAGQGVGLIEAVQPVGEIVGEVAAEYAEAVAGLPRPGGG